MKNKAVLDFMQKHEQFINELATSRRPISTHDQKKINKYTKAIKGYEVLIKSQTKEKRKTYICILRICIWLTLSYLIIKYGFNN